ncbi:hypothetical protein N431DRAFT_353315 [Stipitochalara longipes BDJ]|nr:hypothetical protein N431DRAFT_353315 [Stipitochalara longipes BDJ]
MEKGKEQVISCHENEVPIVHQAPPACNAGISGNTSSAVGKTFTIDPTGMSIIELPLGSAPPVYKFNTSLLHVGSFTSVDISRPDASGNPLAVYSIAEKFISPLHPTRPTFRNVTVSRSFGVMAAIGLRKIEWTFLTQMPIPKDKHKESDIPDGENTAGWFLMTLGADGIGVEKDLLRYFEGKWTDENEQVIALAREGGAECEGMPVLSVSEGLHQEMMDFLISAWCVTLWGEVGKRAHHRHKHSSHEQVIA